MIFAVIPAAGQSTRMGRPKLALPLGKATVLEHVIAALRGGGIEQVLVVIGPHVPELVELARRAGADVCLVSHETPDMRATVEAGLRWVEEHHAPGDDDSWLLVPADHPTLEPAVVEQLLQARSRHAEASIFVPVHQDRRGHPTLIGWKHVAGIRGWAMGQGLNSYLRSCQAETAEIEGGPSVLMDLDTPEDYSALRQRFA